MHNLKDNLPEYNKPPIDGFGKVKRSANSGIEFFRFFVARECGQAMTHLMEQALAEIAKLPEPKQDAIAMIILQEIADELRWDDAFARTQDELATLADHVRHDIRAGRVQNKGIDEL
jgi:hypothetical protein